MQNNRLTVTRGAGELVLAPPHSPLENTEGVGFSGAVRRAGEEGVSPAVGSSSSWRCRTTVKQLHGSSHHVSTANERCPVDQQHEYIHVITEDHNNMATVI